MKRSLLVSLLLLPLLVCAQVPDTNFIAANQVMLFAGWPLLPDNMQGMRCLAWDNVSKGVFATWVTDEAGLDAFSRRFGEEVTPIPEKLLVRQEDWPRWFNPASIKDGGVVVSERRYEGGIEKILVYVDRENRRLYFSYFWG